MIEGIRSWIGHNVATKIISLLIAGVLWTFVLGSRPDEAIKEVPIEIVTPPDLIPSNDVPDRLSFRLSGPKAFLRTILDRPEEPIRVNLSGSKAGVVNYRFFSDNIRVPIGVKVVSYNPTSVVIRLEPVRKRDVPVRLELRGAAPEGYRLVRAELKPSIVRIKGAESRVDSTTEIATVPIDLTGIKQSMEREVALDIRRSDLKVDGDLPRVFIEVEPTSANFRIRNIEVRVLSSYKATVEEKSVTVLVRATAKELKSLEPSKIFAVVDLRGKPKGKHTEAVKVTLPENINLVRVVPDRVTVDLQ